ncbi:helix-turn-helix domain-containing protein [Roseivirga sp.]|uniref:helix-turn-helix domain-containing protein n=1 Tax=Roseivirga sp. TaxID=1964215 RepID=UPI003B8E5D93
MQQSILINASIEDLTSKMVDSISDKIRSIIHEEKTEHPAEELLTRKQTAQLFNVSLQTISDWTKKEILVAQKMGNRVYFKKSLLLGRLDELNLSTSKKNVA